jgi:hypothetical protein
MSNMSAEKGERIEQQTETRHLMGSPVTTIVRLLTPIFGTHDTGRLRTRWMSLPGAKQKRRGEEAMKKRALIVALVLTLLVGAGLYWVVSVQAKSTAGAQVVSGAGTSLIEGGTGAPSFHPVETTFAFHWSNGQGHFECLALTPNAAPGAVGSGTFDTNVMYVTGPITSVSVEGSTAVFKGTASVTGLGAGSKVPFVATATSGGPGTTLVLQISGLTFNEIVLEGQITMKG